MTRTLVALGAALAIGAAAFTQSTPASAQSWVAPVVAGSVIAGGIVGAAVASSPCHGGYTVSVGCCGSAPRGLFTSGFGGGCGCGTSGYPAYGPTPYYTQPGLPYVQPYYYHHRFVHPYVRHYYRPYVRHDYHRYGAYRAYHRAHRHW